MQDLFTWDFGLGKKPNTEEGKEITKNLELINTEITEAAPEWPLHQINRVDLAILRLAIFELIIEGDTPFKVVVDEAVELAKKFGSESSPGFINGVLGKVITAHKLESEKK